MLKGRSFYRALSEYQGLPLPIRAGKYAEMRGRKPARHPPEGGMLFRVIKILRNGIPLDFSVRELFQRIINLSRLSPTISQYTPSLIPPVLRNNSRSRSVIFPRRIR